MNKSELNEALKVIKSVKLPTHPEILMELNKEIAKKDPSKETILNIVSKDVSIAAKTIKFTNSPFFGLRVKADTIDEAFNYLGIENFRNVIMASVIKDSLKYKSIPDKKIDDYFNHSILIAQIANYITDNLPFETGKRINRKIPYVYGLFHDCGTMIMARRYSDYFKVIEEEIEHSENLKTAELKVFKTHHAHVGALLAKSWHFNDQIVKCIQDHHIKSLDHVNDEEHRIHLSILILSEIIYKRTYPSKKEKVTIFHKDNNDDMIDSALKELHIDVREYDLLENAIYSLLN